MGWLKIQKLFEYIEKGTTFPRNKKIINLCLKRHIFRNYCYVAEVTFKYERLPQVFFFQFFLMSRTLSLGIDNRQLFLAIQKSWKKSLLKIKK